MGGPSITIEATIGDKGRAVSLETLIDDGAIAFLVLHKRLAADISSVLDLDILPLPEPYRVSGFDNVARETVSHFIRAILSVDGRRLYNFPFVLADIGRHDLIIGKNFLEELKVLVDPARSRLIWPDEVPPCSSVFRDIVFYPDQLHKRAINTKFQRDADRRNAQMNHLSPPNAMPKGRREAVLAIFDRNTLRPQTSDIKSSYAATSRSSNVPEPLKFPKRTRRQEPGVSTSDGIVFSVTSPETSYLPALPACEEAKKQNVLKRIRAINRSTGIHENSVANSVDVIPPSSVATPATPSSSPPFRTAPTIRVSPGTPGVRAVCMYS